MILTFNLALDKSENRIELEINEDVFNKIKLNAQNFNPNNLSLNLLDPALKTDNLFTTSLIEMFPNILESSIDNIRIKNGGSLF